MYREVGFVVVRQAAVMEARQTVDIKYLLSPPVFPVVGVLIKIKQGLCQAQKLYILCLYSFFLVSQGPRGLGTLGANVY